ncbi:MAG: L-rhamnose mutarotase [Candidatus Latescibacteria bacterium]|jgi:L-rhamnose mutarotase|nr:L-rhamnose mutarotase [Candidatus Latescibacterota bacterium]MBT4136329.1 L-rhamnose mutarotase [Candidatus Latescibacterota bacterium]MBT5831354.1 L-rhamnose mutarotase [Candidatus Latescibacterota bacterium]
MKRIGFLLKVKKDKIDEYKKIHAKVWPELLETLSRCGWHNYSLFMQDDGTLFGYFETPNSLQSAIEAMNNEEINTKWQEMMAPFFESPNGARADEILMELEEVFHL